MVAGQESLPRWGSAPAAWYIPSPPPSASRPFLPRRQPHLPRLSSSVRRTSSIWGFVPSWHRPRSYRHCSTLIRYPRGSAFRRGVLTNVLNPKVALFFLAFLPQFIDSDSPNKVGAFLALGITFVVDGNRMVSILGCGGLPYSRILCRHPAALGHISRASGALFVLLGLRLAASGAMTPGCRQTDVLCSCASEFEHFRAASVAGGVRRYLPGLERGDAHGLRNIGAGQHGENRAGSPLGSLDGVEPRVGRAGASPDCLPLGGARALPRLRPS